MAIISVASCVERPSTIHLYSKCGAAWSQEATEKRYPSAMETTLRSSQAAAAAAPNPPGLTIPITTVIILPNGHSIRRAPHDGRHARDAQLVGTVLQLDLSGWICDDFYWFVYEFEGVGSGLLELGWLMRRRTCFGEFLVLPFLFVSRRCKTENDTLFPLT